MNAEPKLRNAPPIEGHMIALAAGHSIVVYERNGELCVAEFRDGVGGFAYASTWFRFHAGALRYRHNGRGAPRSVPLTPEMVQKIERLHAESEARQERMLALPRTIAAAAQRFCTKLVSRLRRRAAKIAQTFG